ncbi:uncharacterized protein LOC111270851 isoform X2 [Varroa jacobsoni]|nr:uncharacterized protein LOC111270851 isoform X2 [Varroa jacobsoni]XP_022707021.1 uncharacterized protein LOC111270851 isoform X2 [Varroa jacobsoni]XP_022707022.1 uncharacterized protein LOC111270851 isoform X2 [Varroa jacobsoni]
MSDLDADSAAKRPRLNDSDDSDDEIWSHAIEQDEAIQTQRLTQQLLHPVSSQATLLSQQKQGNRLCGGEAFNTQATLMGTQVAPSRSTQATAQAKVLALPTANLQVLSGRTDMNQQMKNLLTELRKRSTEKLSLQRELSVLKSKNANFCANNCKKRLDILCDDLRFKQREIEAQRRRIKELECRRSDSPRKTTTAIEGSTNSIDLIPVPKVPSLAIGQLAKKPRREFPTLALEKLPNTEVLDDFAQADPLGIFACKHFSRWCKQRIRDTEVTEGYVDHLRQVLPAVFEKVVASQDPDVSTALLLFLAHIQRVAQTSVTACIDWRQLLSQASGNVSLLLALSRFLSKSLEAIALFPTLRAVISDETNWRHSDFCLLLDAILEMIQDRPESYESSTVVKQVLRVYREVLDINTDPVRVERILVRALMLSLDGVPIESELVAVVTRGEAFHHLGDVLKKIIRCQPTLSYTGCPEMMNIANECFRDS